MNLKLTRFSGHIAQTRFRPIAYHLRIYSYRYPHSFVQICRCNLSYWVKRGPRFIKSSRYAAAANNTLFCEPSGITIRHSWWTFTLTTAAVWFSTLTVLMSKSHPKTSPGPFEQLWLMGISCEFPVLRFVSICWTVSSLMKQYVGHGFKRYTWVSFFKPSTLLPWRIPTNFLVESYLRG